jgi:hypothetical protein
MVGLIVLDTTAGHGGVLTVSRGAITAPTTGAADTAVGAGGGRGVNCGPWFGVASGRNSTVARRSKGSAKMLVPSRARPIHPLAADFDWSAFPHVSPSASYSQRRIVGQGCLPNIVKRDLSKREPLHRRGQAAQPAHHPRRAARAQSMRCSTTISSGVLRDPRSGTLAWGRNVL